MLILGKESNATRTHRIRQQTTVSWKWNTSLLTRKVSDSFKSVISIIRSSSNDWRKIQVKAFFPVSRTLTRSVQPMPLVLTIFEAIVKCIPRLRNLRHGTRHLDRARHDCTVSWCTVTACPVQLWQEWCLAKVAEWENIVSLFTTLFIIETVFNTGIVISHVLQWLNWT